MFARPDDGLQDDLSLKTRTQVHRPLCKEWVTEDARIFEDIRQGIFFWNPSLHVLYYSL